jgi:hypothetical protein
MARKACGLPEEDASRRRSGLLGWMRGGAKKKAAEGETEDDGAAAYTLEPGHAKL